MIIGHKFSGTVYNFSAPTFQQTLDVLIGNAGFIFLSNVAYFIFDLIRQYIIGRVFNIRLKFSECFGSISLNMLFAWITPGAYLGSPASAFFLYKRGYSAVDSLSIAALRSFSIIIASAISTFIIYYFNMAWKNVNAMALSGVVNILGLIMLYFLVVSIFSFLPQKYLARFTVIQKTAYQVQLILRSGKNLLLPILGLSLFLNFLLVSLIIYAGLPEDNDPVALISSGMLFQSYLLLMPTPGAAGLAEISGPLFFSGLISEGHIISLVSAMRVSTIGIQVSVGLIFMIVVFKKFVSTKEIKKIRES